MRELDERVNTLSLTLLVAQRGSTHSSTCAEGGLPFFFLSPWPELPLFEPELFFLLSVLLLGFTDLSDSLALLELVAFLQLILE